MSETKSLAFRRTSFLLNTFVNNELFDVTQDTVAKTKSNLLEYSAKHPEDELLVVAFEGKMFVLRGNLKEEYIRRNPHQLKVIITNGIEVWRR